MQFAQLADEDALELGSRLVELAGPFLLPEDALVVGEVVESAARDTVRVVRVRLVFGEFRHFDQAA